MKLTWFRWWFDWEWLLCRWLRKAVRFALIFESLLLSLFSFTLFHLFKCLALFLLSLLFTLFLMISFFNYWLFVFCLIYLFLFQKSPHSLQLFLQFVLLIRIWAEWGRRGIIRTTPTLRFLLLWLSFDLLFRTWLFFQFLLFFTLIKLLLFFLIFVILNILFLGMRHFGNFFFFDD